LSRFFGPQHQGASRDLRSVRRVEAEARQRAEAERDRTRRAAHVEPEPLTGDEIASLLAAVATMDWWPA
jgi:hypothetical protein